MGGVHPTGTGRADSRDIQRRRSGLRFCVALLYRRAGVRRLPARTLARGFLESLTRHLRIRRNSLPAEILAAWRRHAPAASADRLQQLLRGAGELRKGDASERQLLTWSRAFDDFKEKWLAEDR